MKCTLKQLECIGSRPRGRLLLRKTPSVTDFNILMLPVIHTFYQLSETVTSQKRWSRMHCFSSACLDRIFLTKADVIWYFLVLISDQYLISKWDQDSTKSKQFYNTTQGFHIDSVWKHQYGGHFLITTNGVIHIKHSLFRDHLLSLKVKKRTCFEAAEMLTLR